MTEIQFIESRNFVATKNVVALDENGFEIQIVTLYGAVELDSHVSYSFNVINKEIYIKHREEIQAEVDLFVAEVKAKIEELGGLTF